MTKNNIHEAYFGIVVIGAIIIVGIILAIVKVQPKPQPITQTVDKIIKNTPVTGLLTLRKQNDREIVAIGEKFDLILTADSFKSPVAGYDAVVNFDPDIVSFNTVKNVNQGFDVVTTKQKGQIIITGTLGESSTSAQLNTSPLTIITFTAAKQGNAKIMLAMEKKPSQRDSNIINDKSVDILNKIDNKTVLVGKKVTVTSEDTKADEATLVITGVQLPAAGCADCVTRVKMQVSQNTQTNRLEFTTGGIAGLAYKPQEAFGVLYEIGEVTKQGVVVYYSPSLHEN